MRDLPYLLVQQPNIYSHLSCPDPPQVPHVHDLNWICSKLTSPFYGLPRMSVSPFRSKPKGPVAILGAHVEKPSHLELGVLLLQLADELCRGV